MQTVFMQYIDYWEFLKPVASWIIKSINEYKLHVKKAVNCNVSWNTYLYIFSYVLFFHKKSYIDKPEWLCILLFAKKKSAQLYFQYAHKHHLRDYMDNRQVYENRF